jgi:hypothetical protein
VRNLIDLGANQNKGELLPIIIQERDLKILKYVFENRVANAEQIKRLAFANTCKTAFYRRLVNLSNAGYINRNGIIGENKRLYWNVTPTSKGLEALGNVWPFAMDKPLFKSESPAHDVRLGEIRYKLEKLIGFESFYPENLLQSSREFANHYLYEDLVKREPDGALNILVPNGGSKLFAVELELSNKSLDRYEKKLSDYYKTNGIDGVIYICPMQWLIDKIAKVDAKIRGRDRSILYFALENSVLPEQDKITFHRLDDPSQSLNLGLMKHTQGGETSLTRIPRASDAKSLKSQGLGSGLLEGNTHSDEKPISGKNEASCNSTIVRTVA